MTMYDPYSYYNQYYNPYAGYAAQNQADVNWFNAGNAANQTANQGQYYTGTLANQAGELGLKRDIFDWQKTTDTAGLTGRFQGDWTMPSNQYFAGAFGTWAPPTAGQQTLAAQQQQYGQGQGYAGMFGRYYAPGETPTAGQQTLAAQQQEFGQGLANRQFGLSQQTQQQQAANQYLSLLASLRGPADWAKYQEVLGAAGGMNALAAQAMGQYIPGGGATSGIQPQAMNLNTLQAQVASGNAQAPWQAGTGVQMPYQQANPQQGVVNPATGTAPNTWAAPEIGATNQYGSLLGPQAQQFQQQNAQQYSGQLQAQRYGGAPASQAQAGNAAPMEGAMGGGQQQAYNQAQQAAGNGTNTMGAPQQNQMNLPAPNQIAPQAWKNMAPSQQQMLLGQYEAQGWHKPDVEALYNQSLTKYGSNAPTAGTFRLR